MTEVADARRAMRTALRRRRSALSDDDQAAASMAVMARLARLPVLRGPGPVSGYKAVRGELDIDAALALLATRGTVVTLPRVIGDHLEFVATDPTAVTAPGPFDIPEPTGDGVVPVRSHTVVLAPVVAFDRAGHRLGQGGGYYDRALAGAGPRPIVIGIAHAFQEVDAVPAEPWDVALDAVVTEEGVHEIRPGVVDPPV